MTRSLMRALALSVCVAATAQAQLGGLLKKAAGKAVEQKAEQKVDDATAKPLEGDPVSANALDALLKGLTFEIDKQKEIDKLNDVRRAKAEELSAANDASRPEADAYRSAKSKSENCVSREIDKIKEKRGEDLGNRMMTLGADPKAQAMMKEYGELSQKLGEAMRKKDTVAQKQLLVRMARALGEEPAKDSAAAYKVCGSPPAIPASYAKALQLEKEHQLLTDSLRTIETSAVGGALKAAGMQKNEYAQGRERLWAWYTTLKARRASGVTKDEEALFKSRQADIQRVAKALR